MLRSLIHHWRINLAVIAGAAVATAVLAGAVIVGDSLQASLRRLTLDRLGDVDWALVGEETFRAALADELSASLATPSGAPPRVAPLLTATATASHTGSRALASGVTLLGVDRRFAALFPGRGEELVAGMERRDGQIFPSAVVNRSLARELGAEVGEDILLSFEQVAEIPRESLLGTQPPEGSLAALRATVTAIVPDAGPGRFSLASHQGQSYNAFVDLAVLQSRLDQRDRLNTLLVSDPGPEAAEALRRALAQNLTLDDLGLAIEPAGDGVLAVSNRRFVLRDGTVEAIERLAGERGLSSQRILGYLANRIGLEDRSIPYSMVVGIDLPMPAGLGILIGPDGTRLDQLADDRIVLGAWAAEELGAEVGRTVELDYYEVGLDDELETRTARLEVAAIAAMSGLMVDRDLLPDFPGIADADDIAAWEPPFPMDLGLIGPRDEAFWDRYGPAPKAAVDLATAERLWANRFGSVTTVRLHGVTDAADVSAALLAALDPASFGLSFEPVKQRGLAAATGATDFAGLFLSFSFFLILAAGLVVGLLFALSVEMRSREIGLLRAVGYPLARVRRALLGEGLILAVAGGLLGIALAVAYAAALIRVIAGLWADRLDLPLLTLDVDPLRVLAAALGALALVALAVVLTVRRLRRLPVPALLAGATRVESGATGGGRARLVATVASVGGAAAIVAAQLSASPRSPALFFVAGALFLVAGLAAFAAWLSRGGLDLAGAGPAAFLRMAARNGAANPCRSLLAVALVACASFMLVSVAANRRVLDPTSLGRDSGTGGFPLVARTTVPVRGSLEDPETRAEIGLGEEAIRHLDASEVVAMRVRPGDDASCLNLYQPETPRIVGVPARLIERGGFAFSSTSDRRDNPWTLLDDDLGAGVIPAIGDANSVTWILHSGLGEEIEVTDDRGRTVRLRLVGLLAKSIFQSELVISEAAFLRHFPHHGGYSYFLLDTGSDDPGATASSLESDLSDYGFDATATVEQLARFLGIEEMYLSTFQLLGGLGLVLGTLGLGIVLVRNVNERRGELAMLRAVGFRRRSIGGMVLLETAFQLACGLAIGTAAGFLALVPYLLDTTLHLPWSSLLATVVAVVAAGLLAAGAGVATVMRTPLLPALKAE
jgi:ABC-type lipoprotein release transport system permease subunit